MTEYFRGALFYLLCFLAGCGFATAVFGWSLQTHRIEAEQQSGAAQSSENAERILRRAFSFGVRQLLFFLALGVCSFLLCGGILWLRARPHTPATAMPTSASQSSTSEGAANAPEQVVNASYLTGVHLPLAARTVNDPSILDASTRQLQRLVTELDTSARLGTGEVLMWRNIKPDKADSVIATTIEALQATNWMYKITNSEKNPQGAAHGAVREFVAVNPKQKKIVTGFWLDSYQFLLLSWGEVNPTKTP
jgi:hypothetical protein